ncbi:hypothetical protein [Streptomyces sp. WAC04114]|uniref:hypothetical protein n=1 Tax=Streptomyces sp. WAC04114 TaxID=2867961 RepID=UPI0021AB7E57|nr:hypothetical protein [Streptomyces sp. WAC04114]
MRAEGRGRDTAAAAPRRPFSFDLDVPYPPEAWRGRIRAGAGLPPDEVERFDDALGRMLRGRFPGDVVQVPHRTWAVVATRGVS